MGGTPEGGPGTSWVPLPESWADAGQQQGAPVARPRRRARRRRRGLWIAVVAVVVLVGAGVAAAIVLGGDQTTGGSPGTVVLPAPTPTVVPAERDTTTAFQQALPDEVLAFAVASQAEAGSAIDAGAVEAYDLTYTDGARQMTLRAAQYASPDAATAAMGVALAQIPAPGAANTDAESDAGAADGASPPAPSTPAVTPREEPVLVDGTEVGRVVIAGSGDAATAVWTNGTALFVLTGPATAVPDFYDAFPM